MPAAVPSSTARVTYSAALPATPRCQSASALRTCFPQNRLPSRAPNGAACTHYPPAERCAIDTKQRGSRPVPFAPKHYARVGTANYSIFECCLASGPQNARLLMMLATSYRCSANAAGMAESAAQERRVHARQARVASRVGLARKCSVRSLRQDATRVAYASPRSSRLPVRPAVTLDASNPHAERMTSRLSRRVAAQKGPVHHTPASVVPAQSEGRCRNKKSGHCPLFRSCEESLLLL